MEGNAPKKGLCRMFELTGAVKYLSKYNKIIYPVIGQRISEYSVYAGRIRKPSVRSMALEALERCRFDAAISSVCALYPHVDIPAAADVMFSFQAIVGYLNTVCVRSSNNTEPFLKLIYGSLKDATNLRTDAFEQYFTFFPSKDDNGYLSILVEKCRQKVRLLPSLGIIRDQLTAFLTLFADLQVTKYSSDTDAREVSLMNWSAVHGQKYSDLSGREFCMASDSSLSILLLLALATVPTATEQEAENLTRAFFPWICGIQKMLEGYINYNEEFFSGSAGYDFIYDNLKEYENRTIFFINNVLKPKTPNLKYLRQAVKILLSLYLTHPRANEGMNKITGGALQKSGGRGMRPYLHAANVLRIRKRF